MATGRENGRQPGKGALNDMPRVFATVGIIVFSFVALMIVFNKIYGGITRIILAPGH